MCAQACISICTRVCAYACGAQACISISICTRVCAYACLSISITCTRTHTHTFLRALWGLFRVIFRAPCGRAPLGARQTRNAFAHTLQETLVRRQVRSEARAHTRAARERLGSAKIGSFAGALRGHFLRALRACAFGRTPNAKRVCTHAPGDLSEALGAF
jgi:hypothetical protein